MKAVGSGHRTEQKLKRAIHFEWPFAFMSIDII